MRRSLTTLLNALRYTMTTDPRVEAAFDGVLLAIGPMPSEVLTSSWRPFTAAERVVPVRVSWPALESRSPRLVDDLCLQVSPHALGYGLEG